MLMMEGAIDPMEIETETYLINLTPEEAMSMTLESVADGNGCFNIAEGSADIFMNYAPETPDVPSGITELDLYEISESSYDILPVTDAESYNWILMPEEAGTLRADATTALVNWDTDFRGQATLKANAVNNCGESDWSEELLIELFSTIGLDENGMGAVKIYPNPAKDQLTLDFGSMLNEKVVLRISNMIGELILEKEIPANINQHYQLSLREFGNGSYVLTLESPQAKLNKPLIINR
jgi:hypothetical protein